MKLYYGNFLLFVTRLCLWLTVALFDVFYILHIGFEGSTNSGLLYTALTTYLILGLAMHVITRVAYSISLSSKPDRKPTIPELSWDFALILLLIPVFRVNETYLPSITDPVSIGWNIGMFAGIAILILILRPLFQRVWLVLVISLILPVIGISYGLVPLLNENKPDVVLSSSPNIVLITLDTVRADHLGCYGYDLDTSPVLDQFAADNYTFTNCRTPMPLTAPAHASLFSGEMPHEHGVLTNISAYPDGDSFETIAGELYRNGYVTAGFPSAVHMGRQFNFDRGFSHYNTSTVLSGPSNFQSGFQVAPIAILSRLGLFDETHLARNSRQVNTAATGWLDANIPFSEENSRPLFVWLHYFDAHSPYQPPDEYWQTYDPDYSGSVTGSQEECDYINSILEKTNQGDSLPEGFTQEDIDNLIARYDGEIRYQDESLGELLDYLSSYDVYEDSVIIIVSDHGEGMYEDGYFGHNFTLEEYETRLACVIKGPGIVVSEDSMLSITDLTDYMRFAAGLIPADECRLTTDSVEEPDDDPYTSMVFLKSHCWIEPPYKLVRTWQGEGSGIEYALFNYIIDPGETINLFDIDDELSIGMKERLQEWLESNRADFPELLENERTLRYIDPSTMEMLRSLGYIY